MGEVKQEVRLENYVDRYLFLKGKLKEEEIRKETAVALVDTGAVMAVLPQEIVEKLELEKIRKVIVAYADERKEERDVAGGVIIAIGDRVATFDCIIGPPLSEPLLGQVVLEELDLIVDCKENKLTARPESPRLPFLKIK